MSDGEIYPSLKFKDNFGELALLSDWFRAEFYHILRNNPASFSINGIAVTMFTEQSQSTLDKFEMEGILANRDACIFLSQNCFSPAFTKGT